MFAVEQIASMQTTLKQKAEDAEVKRISALMPQINSTVAQKADASVVEQLSQQYTSLSANAATKGELAALSARLEQVSAKIDANMQTIQSTLLNFNVAEMSKRLDALDSNAVTRSKLKENLTPLNNMLDSLNTMVLQKAEKGDLLSLRTALDAVQGAIKGKAEGSLVEQLNTQYRQINKVLTQKAEYTEVEDLRSQVKVLGTAVEQKAGQGDIDILNVTLKGLSGGLASTIDEKVDQRVLAKYKIHLDDLNNLKSSLSDVQNNLKEKATVANLDKLGKEVHVLVEASAHAKSKFDKLGKQLEDLTASADKTHKELKAEIATGLKDLGTNLDDCKTTIAKKADDVKVNNLATNLDDCKKTLAKKADDVKVDILSTNLDDCKKAVAKKADDVKVDKLAALMAGFADKAVVETLVKQMSSAADTLARKSTRLDELETQVKEVLNLSRLQNLDQMSAILAKINNLDNLSQQVDLIFTKMASKVDNAVMDSTVEQLTTRVNTGMDTMSRRIRMLIDALINTVRRNALGMDSSAVRVGGGFATENVVTADPPDADLINVLQRISAEDSSPRASVSFNLGTFGTDSPLSSPRINTRVDDSMTTSQTLKEIDELYAALSRKADKTALSTLAAEFQRLSDFTMTQVLQQAPSSMPPGSLRPQSARGGPARPTTPRGARIRFAA